MEFKEKLQILRTQLRMSQEELAARLSISRQSVTKWENGQSFPDIQNLIQLSDIFKVSIDRLVKDNDTCSLNLFGQQQFANQDMRMFGQILSENFSIDFLKEMLSLVSCERPFRGPEYHQKGDYAYYCQVHGDFACFHGEEIIYCKHEKVYFCLFHGGDLS